LLGEEGRSWSGNEPDVLFDNRGGSFVEVGSLLGLHSRLDGRGAAAADLDDDGDLDLVVLSRNSPTVRIYRNEVRSTGHALLVDLGPAADSGRAIGAEIEAHCGDARFLRLVSAGSSFLAQAPPRVHFGLGDCSEVDRLIIRNRGEVIEVRGPIPVDTRIVVAGAQVVSTVPLRPREAGETIARSGGLSIPVPSTVLDGLGGGPGVEIPRHGTVVLNFWATWCTACAAEHDDLLRVAALPALADATFVAISRDAPDAPPSAQDLASWGPRFIHAGADSAGQAPFSAAAGLGADAVPLTVVIQDGVIRWTHPGAVGATALRQAIDSVRP
jgi:thiol-disulfide isomerase/thioredoxin